MILCIKKKWKKPLPRSMERVNSNGKFPNKWYDMLEREGLTWGYLWSAAVVTLCWARNSISHVLLLLPSFFSVGTFFLQNWRKTEFRFEIHFFFIFIPDFHSCTTLHSICVLNLHINDEITKTSGEDFDWCLYVEYKVRLFKVKREKIAGERKKYEKLYSTNFFWYRTHISFHVFIHTTSSFTIKISGLTLTTN